MPRKCTRVAARLARAFARIRSAKKRMAKPHAFSGVSNDSLRGEGNADLVYALLRNARALDREKICEKSLAEPDDFSEVSNTSLRGKNDLEHGLISHCGSRLAGNPISTRCLGRWLLVMRCAATRA